MGCLGWVSLFSICDIQVTGDSNLLFRNFFFLRAFCLILLPPATIFAFLFNL